MSTTPRTDAEVERLTSGIPTVAAKNFNDGIKCMAVRCREIETELAHERAETSRLENVIFNRDGEIDHLRTALAAEREKVRVLREACEIARTFMSIASDWNIDEAEINGEMRSTYDWMAVIEKAIATTEARDE